MSKFTRRLRRDAVSAAYHDYSDLKGYASDPIDPPVPGRRIPSSITSLPRRGDPKRH